MGGGAEAAAPQGMLSAEEDAMASTVRAICAGIWHPWHRLRERVGDVVAPMLRSWPRRLGLSRHSREAHCTGRELQPFSLVEAHNLLELVV